MLIIFLQIVLLVCKLFCLVNFICDNESAGCPGSTHHARVFRISPLSNRVIGREQHLLGDSAYPCSINLITPYKDNGHLTRNQQKFNRAHSATRVVIEQSFGFLKSRFRCLKN